MKFSLRRLGLGFYLNMGFNPDEYGNRVPHIAAGMPKFWNGSVFVCQSFQSSSELSVGLGFHILNSCVNFKTKFVI